MLGDKYERPEGSGAMTQSLTQMDDRLAIVGTSGTQAPHVV
jgi:hypothetical protein